MHRNCSTGSNNIYYDFPPDMNDGRNFAEWRPEAVINTTIRNKNNIKTNWEFRKYLQNNSNSIIKANQLLSCDECCTCPYYNTTPSMNTPFLYASYIDNRRPFGYETSDMKAEYLSRQELEARMMVPNADQSFLLPFKRAN